MTDQNHTETVERLRRMIRIDTVNPPGNEKPLTQMLAAELRDAGVPGVEVIESQPGRASLAVRVRGDGSQRPLLLMSHLDVVPVEAEHWQHPPFGGDLVDGFVYGRGAIDSKLTAAVHLQVLLMLHRAGVTLTRDLVLIAAADEEFGGHHGMEYLARERPDLFDAEFGLNEAGGFAVLVDGQPVYTCQAAEKGGADFDVIVGGRPGHSSVPHQSNPIVHLAPVLAGLGGKLPHRVIPAVGAFFERAAQAARPEVAEHLRALLDPTRCDEALSLLPVAEPVRFMFDAMLRNTCTPTMLEAGVKRNVIPSSAAACLSGRPLPGVSAQEMRIEIEALLADPGAASARLELGNFRAGVSFDHAAPLLGVLERALQRHEAGACLAPYMQTGGTDARFLADLDLTVYGFVPMRHEEGVGTFFELCHGHDECVSAANVGFALDVIHDAVADLNGLPVTAC
ncbi:MAG: M20/M25/M40 family metallo-hydrolase [Gemmatimonadetes bacterium]|jgi:acetylornithine deacetylase/succinyl-diaminopimelate desuccinylase-like protein|nr:M20/M25/M40 family metallo-hydrolase [Gemmatimonadota bacterium]MBT6148982.1 M20/M25/M40 family metallo-hydrolase [Gemmatimonadota bacterium]MBT7859759.1 M20/M25/M40 family metallo-hydrolase [Gemmatimonadota bacterium]